VVFWDEHKLIAPFFLVAITLPIPVILKPSTGSKKKKVENLQQAAVVRE
jgi:hypothetical protein